MDEHSKSAGPAPRLEKGHFLLIAGLGGHFTPETTQGISELWERFIPHLGKVPDQVGEVTYGVCCNPDGQGGFDYIAGVEISRLDDLPELYRWIELPAQPYVVLEHQGPLSSVPQTFGYLLKTWLPQSGREAAEAPAFERYSADFNPCTGQGVLEVWLPLKEQ
ncbi:GyrI-like domain-containing protein [Pseudomonas sp. NPDC089530]|uniref:GyrI-like domain-containing protein n=1 Tax=Pseudomonas sp. NPDC089530 TaxID=3390651 RepID=UPI003D056576